MLDKVKMALRVSTDAFDEELADLIESALLDLGIAGVENQDVTDPLIRKAVITFCKINFGDPQDYERLKRSYDEQKSQLSTATGYTDWGNAEC